MEIRKITRNDINAVAKLLADRHRKERAIFQGLNPVFEEKSIVKDIISKMFEEDIVIAIGAFEDSELIGYIISHVMKDHTFGRCAWVKYEGTAISESADPEVYRELYRYIADLWLAAGCLKH